MNYELVKQLEDAGFPELKEVCPYGTLEECKSEFSTDQAHNHLMKKFPTLSELIAACGVIFTEPELPDQNEERLIGDFILYSSNGKWTAGYQGYDMKRNKALVFLAVTGDFRDRPYGFGNTPEEAVANLWLALNAKNGHNSNS